MAEDKLMQFGNFNITFGTDEEPMLNYFNEIIYPALMSNLTRGERDKSKHVFFFSDVSLNKDKNGDFLLIGNIVKDFEVEIISKIINGELEQVSEQHPDAPFSRFVVFLKNHRMVLVKNEPSSPDMRSFNRTVENILHQYISKQNAIRRKQRVELLPYALVNIVGIPMEDSIVAALENVGKIGKLHLRVYPLNGDKDYNPLIQHILEINDDTKSKNAQLSINQPTSKSGVKDVLESTGGIVEPILDVKYFDGSKGKIREDRLTESVQIRAIGSLHEGDADQVIISTAQQRSAITKTTDSNLSIYNKAIEMLTNIFR